MHIDLLVTVVLSGYDRLRTMLTQSEKKVLWHPRGENRFIVGGGSQITLYEWSPDEPAIRHVTSQQDMQHMKVRLCLMFGVVENLLWHKYPW